MVVCEYEHTAVRVFPLISSRKSGLIVFRSFASGSLGPVTFGLGLRDSCLVILFFNLLCAVAPAYL